MIPAMNRRVAMASTRGRGRKEEVMANVRTDGRPQSQVNGTRDRRARGFIAGTTEARPGIMTTEFWLTVLAAIGVVIAGYVSDTFDNDLAWALGAGLIAAYSLSRGFAKSGSREGPFVVGMGDRDDDR
jgi:hypothetical protein